MNTTVTNFAIVRLPQTSMEFLTCPFSNSVASVASKDWGKSRGALGMWIRRRRAIPFSAPSCWYILKNICPKTHPNVGRFTIYVEHMGYVMLNDIIVERDKGRRWSSMGTSNSRGQSGTIYHDPVVQPEVSCQTKCPGSGK